MLRPDTLSAELRTVWQLLRGQHKADTHAARLEAFYGSQAAHYDRFRERLLVGRREMIAALDIRAGQRVVELGAGTGRNAEFFADIVPVLERLTLVDLCPALLAQARVRTARWPNCEVVENDAGDFQARHIDRVFMSYALSMMPNWRQVVERACTILARDGLLGVVDFYVSAAQPEPGLRRHSAFTRRFWPWWFQHDGVRLSSAALSVLKARLTEVHRYEGLASVPYLPGLRVPYYIFIGRRH